MANEMIIAQQMAQFAANSMRSAEQAMAFLQAATLTFLKYMENEAARDMLLQFYKDGLGQEAKLKDGEKLGILSYDIQPGYAKQLHDICKRDKIAYMDAQSNTFDLVMDGKGDNIKKIVNSMWIYNTQQNNFHLAVAEAKARSGYEQEIPREIGNQFISSLINGGNPMKEIKDVPLEQYLSIRNDIQKLNKEMRFTLFPSFHIKDGQQVVDIGFLSKTEKLYNKKGFAYTEPQQYNIPEMMKGMLYKQKMIERDPDMANYFERIQKRESFKQKTIETLLEKKPPTIRSIERNIYESRLDNAIKEALNKKLQKYYQNPEIKQSLISDLENLKEISDRERNFLIKSVKDLGKESYIVPAKIVRDGAELEYEMSTKESICIGYDMTIRKAGKDDLVIEDPSSMKNNLDRKLSEFTDKGKTNEQFTFVVLSAEEYNQIEKGNPEFIGLHNRIKKKKINFFKDYDEKTLYEQTEQEKTVEKKWEGIIDKINQNKEKFILESDTDLKGIERFDEHHEAVIQEIITEQDHKEEIVGEELETIKDNLEAEVFTEINNLKIEPVIHSFDEYIRAEIKSVEILPQIGVIEQEVATR